MQRFTGCPSLNVLVSSNTEHFFANRQFASQAFILVFMKHEKHISITLCDVSNDFR